MSGKFAFSQALKELRFLFCQKSAESKSIRSFLTRAYPKMKQDNPQIPIMIREAAGTQPRVFARYDLSDAEVEAVVSRFVNAKS
ncbi:hypothetical protein Golomagni_02787 [Golovinomyces magnicellulatus]|nr:hypothetical protein Golomagni_02787 [Golovinomyces magnicellulatus]